MPGKWNVTQLGARNKPYKIHEKTYLNHILCLILTHRHPKYDLKVDNIPSGWNPDREWCHKRWQPDKPPANSVAIEVSLSHQNAQLCLSMVHHICKFAI